jgi:TonB-linked SusC/RagA family outer membrane protein
MNHIFQNRRVKCKPNLQPSPIKAFRKLLTFIAIFFCSISSMTVYAASNQASNVSGRVLNEKGESMPGVTVTIVGEAKGTVTNIDGHYSLDVSQGKSLRFTFIGYDPKTVVVKSQKVIDINLDESSSSLTEVVVTGYGSVSRKNLTTAISKVKTDDIQKSSSSNVTQLLVGRAAGLQATVASAQPGGNVNMSIRGGKEPAYVVDGVMMPNNSQESGAGGGVTVIPNSVNRGGLAGLNPEDIESVEVLKDASVAIYGIGAANGVILITTKKGKEGKMKIGYDGSYSVVNNYKYLQPLNSQEYMGLVNVFSKEQYLYNNKMAPYGTTAYNNGWSQPYSAQSIADAKTTNWRDEVLKNGSISNHNITISGGTKALSYYFSGNYFKQVGSVANSQMERFAARGNIVAQLNSFMKLSTTFNMNENNYINGTVGGSSHGRGSQAAGALSSALTYLPNIPTLDANGKYSVFLNVPNPVALQNLDDKTASNGSYVNFNLNVDIIKNMLSAKLLYGYNREASRRSVFIPDDLYFDQMYKSRGNLGEDNRRNQTMEATLAFTKSFDFMNVDAVVGMGKYLDSYNGMNVSYDGMYTAIGNDNLSAATGVITPGSYRTAFERRSQFGRVSFDILDKYVVAATVRRDGTDKFFPDNKYAFFPSVSLAWKISNESFMKNIPWLGLLKVRTSYGETGLDNLGSSLYGSYGPWGTQIMFNNGNTKYVPIIQNGADYPNVTWEKTVMKNVGIDFSVLKDRISGSFDMYQNNVTNMLDNKANTSALDMYATFPRNGAYLRRQGWDATLNTKNVTTKNFAWNSVLTLSRNNAIWIERMPNTAYAEYQVKDHEPVNALYYYQTNGIINADKSNMPASQPANAQIAGYPIIVDRNGDGKISVADVRMQNNVPKIYFGFGNTFTYKNFDLDVFVYSQLGLKKYNYSYSWLSGAQLANKNTNENIYAFNIWNSQTNPNGTYPGIAWDLASVSLPGNAGTDIGYENASFLRVRNITLGYNITSTMLGSVGKYIRNLRIYVDAQNPITITSFKGTDPEVITGGDYKSGKAEYPQTRTFSVGIKAAF